MSELIFEQNYRGDVWRLEIVQYQGRKHGNWRKWYLEEGSLKPTRQGVTIPLERLAELTDSLVAWSERENRS